MSSPVAVIADALIAFILSLLRDPEAVEEFTADPQTAMMRAGVGDACVADVRAVAPVIVDHPSVTPMPPPPDPPEPPDPVVKEIFRLVSQFTTIDARSTIVDQSVNQNIWTNGGDVTQLFDQEAMVASGDGSVAAGDDATLTNTDTDITTGDVNIGNNDYDGSFNQDGSDNSTTDDSFQNNSTNDSSEDTTVEDSLQDNSTDVDVEVEDSNVEGSAVTVVTEAAPAPEPAPAPAPEPVAAAPLPQGQAYEEPADVLESDMTVAADDTYEADAATVVTEEPVYQEPVEEQ